MQLTNRLNLPDALVNAVKNDSYDNGGAWRSVTGLLKPPRAAALEQLHKDELSEDVAERLFALYGQIVHGILERANGCTNTITEKRLFMEVMGKRISGQFDSIDIKNGHLVDWKFSTAWKAKGGAPIEWVEQCNLLAVLLRANGVEVKSAGIGLLMRDHSKLEALRSHDYPQLPVAMIEIPLWSPEKQNEFMMGRVKAHLAAEKELPLCTSEERWAKTTVYAVMKEGRKSSVRNFENVVEADLLSKHLGGGHSVVVRPGESIRCKAYCRSAPWCLQWKAMRETNGH